MSLHDDLLEHARRLSELDPVAQTEADCRRSVSAAYYALFHLIVDEAAPLFAADPRLPSDVRSRLESQVRRMFSHTEVRKIVENLRSHELKDFFKVVLDHKNPPRPQQLLDFAKTFVELQKLREQADYDIATSFSASQAKESVSQAREAFQNWNAVKNEPIARAFLASLLLENKGRR